MSHISAPSNPVPMEVFWQICERLDHPNQFGTLAKVCRAWRGELNRPDRAFHAYQKLERALLHQMLANFFRSGYAEPPKRPNTQIFGHLGRTPEGYHRLDHRQKQAFDLGFRMLKLKPPEWSWKDYRVRIQTEFRTPPSLNKGALFYAQTKRQQAHHSLDKWRLLTFLSTATTGLYLTYEIAKNITGRFTTANTGNAALFSRINALAYTLALWRTARPMCSAAYAHHDIVHSHTIHEQRIARRLHCLVGWSSFCKSAAIVLHYSLRRINPQMGGLRFSAMTTGCIGLFALGEKIWSGQNQHDIPFAHHWDTSTDRHPTTHLRFHSNPSFFQCRRLRWLQTFAKKMDWSNTQENQIAFNELHATALSDLAPMTGTNIEHPRDIYDRPSSSVTWLRQLPPID